jgi:tetratricopeptide (TPR) repeat protein
MTGDSPDGLEDQIDRLLHGVRMGKFIDCRALADSCFEQRSSLASSDIRRLQISSLNWEIYEALGFKTKARDRLEADEIVTECATRVEEALADVRVFRRKEFPAGLSKEKREENYALWRQRVICLLAGGFAAFRHDLTRHAERLFTRAGDFIAKCLIPAGFPCSGTQARLHFFRARLKHETHHFDEARDDYDDSLRFCYARLDEQLELQPDSRTREQETEFAAYCSAKVHENLGELEFHQGHLRAAERHLLTAKILLRSTQDKFLLNRAEIFLCLVTRSDTSFGAGSWEMLEHLSLCREQLENHPEYRLEARLEEVKTAVYLHHSKVTGQAQRDDLNTFAKALEVTKTLIEEAKSSNLISKQFEALLVKARILIRLMDGSTALETVDQALELYRNRPPAPLAAEAMVVKAKAFSSQQRYDDALEHLQHPITKGHASQLFHASRQLSIAELLLVTRNLIQAEHALRRCSRLLRRVQSSYLHERFKRLWQQFQEASAMSIQFGPDFELRAAEEEIERRYLIYLAALIHKPIRDILMPAFWKDLRKRGVVKDRRQIKHLMAKHFPEESRSFQAKAAKASHNQ